MVVHHVLGMSSDRPGKIGPYEIRQTIGRGGMAAVYTGYQSTLDRIVAIKVISQHLASEAEFMSRFRQEALAIARLTHPNVITVHDFGEDGGVPYLVMEYVEGVTLGDMIESGLTLDQVEDLLGQMASGLDYAHSRGIVHRDVKPQNVLVTPEGRAVLADFGLARMIEGSQNLTMSGGIVGTPEYMSPEQAAGRATDHRTDVYALGVILYEMLAGERPFTAESPLGVLMKHIQEAPRPLSDFVRDLPQGLDAMMDRALAKDPQQRFQKAGELVSAFRALRSGIQAATLPNTLPAAAPASPTPVSGDLDLSRYEGLRQAAVKTDKPHLTPSLAQLKGHLPPPAPREVLPPSERPPGPAEPPVRHCPSCQAAIPPSVSMCPNCMYLFPFEQLSTKAPRQKMERKQVRVNLLPYNLRWDPSGLARARAVLQSNVDQLVREGWEVVTPLEGSGTFIAGKTAAGQVVQGAVFSVQRPLP